MTYGTVKWFNAEQGFGFITSDVGIDLFVRRADVRESEGLRRDQRVAFDPVESPNGPLTQNVRSR